MKEIINLLEKWREERNITDASTIIEDIQKEIVEAKEELELNNRELYIVELADIGIFCLNWAGVKKKELSYSDTKIDSIEFIELNIESAYRGNNIDLFFKLREVFTICRNIALKHNYDFEAVIKEKIKVVNTRKQCPIQQMDWELHGANGKWEKDKKQDRTTIYVADYESCKIGQ